MIEYLLILTLTAALVLAISKGVGRPLQDYMKNNVLDMVGCMLRVGQFPTKSFGLCQQAIKINMDVANSLADSGGGSNGSNGSSGKTGPNDSNSATTNSDRNDETANNNSNDSNNDRDDSESSNRARIKSKNSTGSLDDSGNASPFSNGSTTRIKISNDDSGESSKEIGSGAGGSNFGETTVIVRRIKREDGRVGGSFLIDNDKRNGSAPEGSESYQAVTSQRTRNTEFNRNPTGQSFSIPDVKDSRVIGGLKDENVDFSFLGMIKWIIILIVLIIIGVFAASQLNSIRKGWTD